MLLIYSRADRHYPISQIQPRSKVLQQDRLDHMEESLQQMTEQLAALRTHHDEIRQCFRREDMWQKTVALRVD